MLDIKNNLKNQDSYEGILQLSGFLGRQLEGKSLKQRKLTKQQEKKTPKKIMKTLW